MDIKPEESEETLEETVTTGAIADFTTTAVPPTPSFAG